MTKLEKLQLEQSLNFLVYGAQLQLMLESYGNSDQLAMFNRDLLTKHKNILVNWERESAKIFKFLQDCEGGLEVIQQYYQVVNVFEKVIQATKDGAKFDKLFDKLDEL